jgi:hypothetical protein
MSSVTSSFLKKEFVIPSEARNLLFVGSIDAAEESRFLTACGSE